MIKINNPLLLPFPWNGGIHRLEERKKKNPERGVNGQPIELRKIGYLPLFLSAKILSPNRNSDSTLFGKNRKISRRGGRKAFFIDPGEVRSESEFLFLAYRASPSFPRITWNTIYAGGARPSEFEIRTILYPTSSPPYFNRTYLTHDVFKDGKNPFTWTERE